MLIVIDVNIRPAPEPALMRKPPCRLGSTFAVESPSLNFVLIMLAECLVDSFSGKTAENRKEKKDLNFCMF